MEREGACEGCLSVKGDVCVCGWVGGVSGWVGGVSGWVGGVSGCGTANQELMGEWRMTNKVGYGAVSSLGIGCSDGDVMITCMDASLDTVLGHSEQLTLR